MPANTVQFGPGAVDFQLAAVREVTRILKQAKGSRKRAVQIVLLRLKDLELLTDDEAKQLKKIVETDFRAAKSKGCAEASYVKVQDQLSDMLAHGNCSSTALALASSSAGSYVGIDDSGGSPVVSYAKKGSNWQGTLAAAGALIGNAIPGVGAGLGAAIGGIAGKIVDECQDDD